MHKNTIADMNAQLRQSGEAIVMPDFDRSGHGMTISSQAHMGLTHIRSRFNFKSINDLLEAIGLFQLEVVLPTSNVCQQDGFDDAMDGFPDSFDNLYPNIDRLPPAYYESYLRGYYEGRYQSKQDRSQKQIRRDIKLKT